MRNQEQPSQDDAGVAVVARDREHHARHSDPRENGHHCEHGTVGHRPSPAVTQARGPVVRLRTAASTLPGVAVWRITPAG